MCKFILQDIYILKYYFRIIYVENTRTILCVQCGALKLSTNISPTVLRPIPCPNARLFPHKFSFVPIYSTRSLINRRPWTVTLQLYIPFKTISFLTLVYHELRWKTRISGEIVSSWLTELAVVRLLNRRQNSHEWSSWPTRLNEQLLVHFLSRQVTTAEKKDSITWHMWETLSTRRQRNGIS